MTSDYFVITYKDWLGKSLCESNFVLDVYYSAGFQQVLSIESQRQNLVGTFITIF